MAKQNLITLFVLLFSFFNLNIAQITISGTISDPNFNSVSNALVEIFDQNDTLNKYTATTDISGNFIISNITDIKNYESNLPNDYLFLRNYPNPFNPSTIIYFEIPTAENIEIKIFDILGREIRTLFSGFHKAGADQINWDGRNNYSHGVSAGIYLCQLKTKDRFKVHKLVFLDGGTNSSGNISYNKISNQGFQKTTKVNARFNFNVKVTGDSLDATYFRNLTCTKDTTLNLIVSKIIKTETIGIAGGVVGNDDFKISIPSGAFDGDYNISISKVENAAVISNSMVTPLFKVNNIPSNFSKPLKIISKYTGNLSEQSYLFIEKLNNSEFVQDSNVILRTYMAYDSSGFLVSEIPVDISSNNLYKTKDIDTFDFFIRFVSNLLLHETEHFKFDYPPDMDIDMVSISQIFEDSYSMIFEAIDMPTFVTEKYNIEIIPTEIDLDQLLLSKIFSDEKNIDHFKIYMHPVLAKPENYYFLQINLLYRFFALNYYMASEGDQTYINILAYSNWITRVFGPWLKYVISEDIHLEKFLNDYSKFSLEPLNNIVIREGNYQRLELPFNYVPIIEYLRNNTTFKVGQIGEIFKDGYKLDICFPIFAEKILDPLEQNLTDFYKKYINNEILNLPADCFINPKKYNEDVKIYEWDINTETDTWKNFSNSEIGDFQDLSAKLFKINLNYKDLDATQNLKFSVLGPYKNQNLSIILFVVIDGKLEYYGTSYSSEYELKDPTSYIENEKAQFLAVLVNGNVTQTDYLGNAVIDLDVTVTPKPEPPALPHTKCTLNLLNVNVSKHTVYSDTGPVDETKIYSYTSYTVEGQFYGNTFIGFYEDEYGINDTIEVTLNESLDNIVNLYRHHTSYFEDEASIVKNTFDFYIKANDIPLTYQPNADYSVFSRSGLDACNSISYFYFYGTDKTPDWSSEYWSTDMQCTENSKLQISFE